MKQFSEQEYKQIVALLQKLEYGDSKKKKHIRSQLRSLGYRISDLGGANTVSSFESLIKTGVIKVVSQAHLLLNNNHDERKTLNESSKPSKANNENSVASFPPFVSEDSEILILGTMPGQVSLETGEYYAKSGNIFWRIIQELYHQGKPFCGYEDKLSCLKSNHIALWDTLKSASRAGSLDKDITGECLNNIDEFLRCHSNIKKIVFNGKKPSTYYHPSIPYSIALSTSPANNSFSYDERLQSWKEALKRD